MSPTTQTQLFPPPVRDTTLSLSEQKYLASIQYIGPLRVGDTTAGPYAEDLPPAGLNSTTGQSNQNQEIIYIKGSADANGWTINGAISGAVVLSAQYDVARFKSDGTNWYSSCCTSGASGGGLGLYDDGGNLWSTQKAQSGTGTLDGSGNLAVTINASVYSSDLTWGAVAIPQANTSFIYASTTTSNTITFHGTAGASFVYLIFPVALGPS
jgi:hypothetical protein